MKRPNEFGFSAYNDLLNSSNSNYNLNSNRNLSRSGE